MTLIIAAGNIDQFIQVSDRRLTSNGIVKDDEANKLIVLNCANARLAVGFTGIARFGSFETREWILKTLNESAPPDYTAEYIVKRFTEKTSKEFQQNKELKRIPLVHKRLTIMFTGYLYHHTPPLGALAIVSNFQDLDNGKNEKEALNEFKCYFREEHRPNDGKIALFYTIGTLPPVPTDEVKKITDLVKNGKPAHAIVEKLVELLQNLADNPLAENVIGKQLNSIILPRNREKNAESAYHSNFEKSIVYLPDQIVVMSKKLHMNVQNISIQPVDVKNTPPMVGPKLRPKQFCWCKSGKRYKNCHGKPSTNNDSIQFVFKPDE